MTWIPQQVLTFDKTAFGELAVAEPEPLAQMYAVNGLREDALQQIKGTGTITVSASNFVVQSGTAADNITRLVTNLNATYRSGQGLMGRFTAFFETAAANSLQIAGLINEESGFVFGYNGTEFGIARYYGGQVEIQKLQVTTPAGGAENATITVDGTGYTVPLTSGTVQHNAFEIANYLSANVPNYSAISNNDTVILTADFAIVAGAFAFTSATAVAAWTQTAAGAVPTYDWIPQANWTNPPDWAFDPTKGNVFQIKIQYLGYGGISFYMENPNTSAYEVVHVYDYANQHTEPTISDPTFRVGWEVINQGNTTNLTIRGATAAAFNEGIVMPDERPRAIEATVTGVNTTRNNLFTCRNTTEFNGKINRIDVLPVVLILSGEHNKTLIFSLQLNETSAGDLNFQYIDPVNSVFEYATDFVQMNGDGRTIAGVPIRGTSVVQLDLGRLLRYLLPGETLTLSVRTASGVGAEADYSLSFVEDQ